MSPIAPRPGTLGVLTLTLFASGCGAGMVASPGSDTRPDVATEAEWQALRSVRPQPLSSAPRITIGSVDLAGSYPWAGVGRVTTPLGIAELAAAGLLRRRDVHFVERRRFSAAAEAERSGEPRRAGQPAAGVSPGAEYSANAVWTALGPDRAMVEVRLTRLETGDVAGAARISVPADSDPVTLARGIVAGVLGVLDDLGRRPAWQDPLQSDDPAANAITAAGVSTEAVRHFFVGLASEEAWDWEGARRGYQAAARESGFHEATTALARTARLRLGGTLGEGLR